MEATMRQSQKNRGKLVGVLALCLLAASLVAVPQAIAKTQTFQSVAVTADTTGVVVCPPAAAAAGCSQTTGFHVFIGYTGPKYSNNKMPPRSGTCAHSRRYHFFRIYNGVTTEIASGVTPAKHALSSFQNWKAGGGPPASLPNTGAYISSGGATPWKITVPSSAAVPPSYGPGDTVSFYLALDKRLIKKKGKVVATCKAVVGPTFG